LCWSEAFAANLAVLIATWVGSRGGTNPSGKLETCSLPDERWPHLLVRFENIFYGRWEQIPKPFGDFGFQSTRVPASVTNDQSYLISRGGKELLEMLSLSGEVNAICGPRFR
jgi:hypothetical protein